MNIGEVANQAGVAPKTIRYYESVGLIPAATRRANGYRDYRTADLHTLRFIQRARALGFAVAEVEELLTLWRNKRRKSSAVKAMATAKIDEIDRKIAALQAMKRAIRYLTANCHGDTRPECPILDELAGGRA
ncbi:MAG: Cu(I)-responsive transcriptional regulator [Alphaproteobacteria bacterium]|nr:Cu(I)-responsive transcriptional regulator [Alphaproteobacteria bacterium]